MAKINNTTARASDVAGTYWGYRTKYIKQKRVNGKWISWDTRTDKPADFNKIKNEFRTDFKERMAISQGELKQNPLSITQLRQNIGDRLISHDTEVGDDGRPLTINQVKTYGKRMNPDAIEGFDELSPRQEYEFRKMLRMNSSESTGSTVTPSDTPSSTPSSTPSAPSENWSSVFTLDPETGESLGVITRNQRKAFEKKYKNKEYLQSILDKKKIRDRGIYLRQGG